MIFLTSFLSKDRQDNTLSVFAHTRPSPWASEPGPGCMFWGAVGPGSPGASGFVPQKNKAPAGAPGKPTMQKPTTVSPFPGEEGGRARGPTGMAPLSSKEKSPPGPPPEGRGTGGEEKGGEVDTGERCTIKSIRCGRWSSCAGRPGCRRAPGTPRSGAAPAG